MLRSRRSVKELEFFDGGIVLEILEGTHGAADCDKSDDKLVVQARLIPSLSHDHNSMREQKKKTS